LGWGGCLQEGREKKVEIGRSKDKKVLQVRTVFNIKETPRRGVSWLEVKL